MIDVKHLTKWYGRVLAVDDISFHVDKGMIVVFLGPNGAGKSTTLKVLTSYLPATSGKVAIALASSAQKNSTRKIQIPDLLINLLGVIFFACLPDQDKLYFSMSGSHNTGSSDKFQLILCRFYASNQAKYKITISIKAL